MDLLIISFYFLVILDSKMFLVLTVDSLNLEYLVIIDCYLELRLYYAISCVYD